MKNKKEEKDSTQEEQKTIPSPSEELKKYIIYFISGIVLITVGVLIGLQINKNKSLVSDTKLEKAAEESSAPSPISNLSPTVLPTVSEKAQIKTIPLVSTAGWKTVELNGVSFMIPSDASCNNDTACSTVSYNFEVNGRTITTYIYLKVSDYQGGSRREAFRSTHTEIENCNPIYVDSIFGTVKGLQIAIDGGMCQGGGGGIVIALKNKLVTVENSTYKSETKEIYKWPIRDTIISTLK